MRRRPPSPRVVHFRDRTREYDVGSPELRALARLTVPIPGRPGWRRDPLTGREWYSAEWLG